jgi:plasmid stability protein
MAQLVVRKIENAVKSRLQRLARRSGRILGNEVREILRRAVEEEELPTGGLGTEIVALFATVGLAADIPELRGLRLLKGDHRTAISGRARTPVAPRTIPSKESANAGTAAPGNRAS